MFRAFATLAAFALAGCATTASSTAPELAARSYIAKGHTLDAERLRALAVYERTDRILRQIDPETRATYAELGSLPLPDADDFDRDILAELAEHHTAALRDAALAGRITSEDSTFSVRDVLRAMRSTALEYLKQCPKP